MNNEIIEAINIVSKINEELFEIIGYDACLEFKATGEFYKIDFLGKTIWGNDVADERESIQVLGIKVKKDLEVYIREEIREIIANLSKIKL